MYSLGSFIAQVHPRFGSLRARRNRRLNAIKPSKANELWYAQQLDHHLVTRLRVSGKDVAAELRNHWPPPPAADTRVHDAAPPDAPRPPRPHQVTAAVARARHAFPHPGGFAIDLATKVVKRNQETVDTRLSASIEASTGVDIRQTLMLNGPVLNEMHRVQQENVELITSLPEDYFDRLEDTISESWLAGERWEELGARLGEIGEITQNRAAFIARDQTSKSNCHFNRVRQTSLGVNRGEWQTAGDGDVRESHAEMDGEIFEWDDPPLVGDENLLPGEDYNCRCTAAPVIDLDDDAPEDLDDPDAEETEEDEEVADEDG
jgi:SPP1 gp7 family putative phage head morphogenesis protein